MNIIKAMLVSLLTLAQAVTNPAIHRDIPEQEVTSNEKIHWQNNIPEGYYDVKLALFPRRAAQHGRIMLMIYKDDRQIAKYTATRQLLSDTLISFQIIQPIKINIGEHLEIHYKGVGSFLLREDPSSYIILTELENATVPTTQTMAAPTTQTVAARGVSTFQNSGILIIPVILILSFLYIV